MRNPMIFENFARNICDFNFNSQAQKDVNKIEELDPKYVELRRKHPGNGCEHDLRQKVNKDKGD